MIYYIFNSNFDIIKSSVFSAKLHNGIFITKIWEKRIGETSLFTIRNIGNVRIQPIQMYTRKKKRLRKSFFQKSRYFKTPVSKPSFPFFVFCTFKLRECVRKKVTILYGKQTLRSKKKKKNI